MSKPKMTDEALLAGIRSPVPAERDQALSAFYVQHKVLRGQIEFHVVKWRGSKEEAADVIVDAMATFDQKIRNHEFKGGSSLSTFFFGIAKNHWRDEFKKKVRSSDTPTALPIEEVYGLADDADDPETAYLTTERKRMLYYAIAQLSPKCQEALNHYILGYSNREAAAAMGLSSDSMAKKTSYECRMKLRALIEGVPAMKAVLNPPTAHSGQSTHNKKQDM